MDQAEWIIILVVVGTVIGLIVTGDNEPTPAIVEPKEDKPHIVDIVPPERSIHDKIVIKNPETILLQTCDYWEHGGESGSMPYNYSSIGAICVLNK